MKLNDFAVFVNMVGVVLVLIFDIRWGGRPPRNAVIGGIGLAMIFVAGANHLALWATRRS